MWKLALYMYEGCSEPIETFILLFSWEKRETVEISTKKKTRIPFINGDIFISIWSFLISWQTYVQWPRSNPGLIATSFKRVSLAHVLNALQIIKNRVFIHFFLFQDTNI